MKKSYLEELEKKEKLAEFRKQKVIESHKCFRCEWSKVELIIIETPENETSIDGILPSEESEEQKAIDDKVEQFRTEWVGKNELKNLYKVTTTQLHNAIWFHRYENSENVTLYTINNPPASLESEKVYKKDGVEFQYIKDSEISKRYGQGLYFKRSDLKREGVIK